MARAIDVLEQMKLDFMVHDAVPDNHRFLWRRFGRANPDFDRRLSLYAGHHHMLEQESTPVCDAAQLLAIAPSGDPTSLHDELARYLPNLNIVRTTSPLDHCSVWYEIFPKTVGKSHAAQWVCDHFGLDAATALAVGNDFNDVDMLRWASVARVVANAPEPLVQGVSVGRRPQRSRFQRCSCRMAGEFRLADPATRAGDPRRMQSQVQIPAHPENPRDKSVRNQAPVMKKQHVIGDAAHLTEIMGDHQNSDALAVNIIDDLFHQSRGRGIEMRRRFVQKQHPRL